MSGDHLGVLVQTICMVVWALYHTLLLPDEGDHVYVVVEEVSDVLWLQSWIPFIQRTKLSHLKYILLAWL